MTNEEHLKDFLDEKGLTEEFTKLLKQEDDLLTYYGATGVVHVVESINLPFRWPVGFYWNWSAINDEWKSYVITNSLIGYISGSKFIELVELKQPAISNEDILRIFLQKYRVLTKFRRNHKRHRRNYSISTNDKPVREAIGTAFGWHNESTEIPKHISWVRVHSKWLCLVDEFKLEGRIDLSKL